MCHNGSVAINTGARQANRQRIEAAVFASARRQLATVGATGLSLRDIARDLDMVSSAIYRYVANRDALLTRLIIDSYNALGEAVEADIAASRRQSDTRRWVRAASTIRAWAVAHPHDFLLLYGTPVPGYAAPATTVDPGIRVTLALAGIVNDAHRAGRLEVAAPGPQLSRAMANDLARVASEAALDLSAGTVLAFFVSWTQLFGLAIFEVTHQTRGLTSDHAALFEATAKQSAHNLGLRDTSPAIK